MMLASGASSVAGAVVFWSFVVPLIIGAYFAPSIVATVRHIHGLGQVIVVNFFFGWTFVGWVVALAMAFRHSQVADAQHAAAVQYAQGEARTARHAAH